MEDTTGTTLKMQDKDEWSALMHLCGRDSSLPVDRFLSIIMLILEADYTTLYQTSQAGNTALHLLCQHASNALRQTSGVHIMLRHDRQGTLLGQQNHEGWTPLM
jgi:hypothetical protein